MLRFRASNNAKAAYFYFSKSDSGIDANDLRSMVGGKAASMLDLDEQPDFEQFKNVLFGLHPDTGEQLTAKLVENRIAYWDITASIPKGVTIAIESGDSRVQDALWEAGRETMADIEGEVVTRKRKGGAQEDRVSGNLLWYGFEHPETRPNREDGMPDPDRHIHFVVPNLTFDPAEKEWKAIKFRPIMDLRKYFDRRFDARLARKLTDLGYEVQTKYKAHEKGGMKYFSWDIKGMPESVIKKFSRRGAEVDELAEGLGINDPTSKDKLGATSRQFKREDKTLEDYREYWSSRITPAESRKIEETIKAANMGSNPDPQNTADKAVRYAIDHVFERRSVADWHDLAITAIERSLGGAHPDEIIPEAVKQGLLVRGDEATTRNVLAEEGRVVAFAREGRGTCGRMGVGSGPDVSGHRKGERVERSEQASPPYPSQAAAAGSQLATATANGQAVSRGFANLSPEQLQIARHVWDSPDRVILIRGAAGTGKTHTMKATIEGIDRPVIVLAPSADASRGVLRKEGFAEADTVARFLMDEKFQETAKGGVIWVDEAGLLGIRQVREVFDAADRLGARVVLQGDKRQHASVERGATLRVLEQFAGLPVAELKDIRRQKGRYKEAVESLSKGDFLDGYDTLADLGWVKQTPVFDHNKLLVADYMTAVDTKRSDQEVTDRVLVVAPTHIEGDEITADIRTKLKERGMVSKDDRTFETLRPLGWTEAERGDKERYDGTEIVQWHRNSGPYRAGDKIRVADLEPGKSLGRPGHFSVYHRTELALAKGDRIRITSNGKTKDGKHKLNNGSQYTVKGFTKEGDVTLSNNWVIAKGFDHLTHGYVTTSHASQGKTVDRVLIAMGHESRPAMSSEQFYVSVSRGRDAATIYTDLNATTLREAIQKSDPRKSATELVGPDKRKLKRREKMLNFLAKIRRVAKALQERAANAIEGKEKIKEQEYERVR